MNRNSLFYQIENEIYRAVTKHQKCIKINQHGLNVNNMSDIMQNMIDNHPDVFYVNEWEYFFSNNDIVVYPKYNNKKKK